MSSESVIKDASLTRVDYRSFQNADSTWGFTIFMNGIPFRQYNRIPVRNAISGFISRKQAEDVAGIFARLIESGESSPVLDRKSIDTLGIILSNRKLPDS